MEIILGIGLGVIAFFMLVMSFAASVANTGLAFYIIGLFSDATRCRERLIAEAIRPAVSERITFSRYVYSATPWAIAALAMGGALPFFIVVTMMAYAVISFNKVI